MKVLKMKRAGCPEIVKEEPTTNEFVTVLKSAIIAYQMGELTLLKYMNVPAVEAPDFTNAIISMTED